MALYSISGVWKDTNGTITHYAVHTSNDKQTSFSSKIAKTSKQEAIELVENKENIVTTIYWNYTRGKWFVGEEVYVIGSGSGRYLKSLPDGKLTDNLSQLIDWAHFEA